MKALLAPERRSILATMAVCLVLYLVAVKLFPAIGTFRVFFNFFSDNAFLGVIAIGLTLVILTGGIDLSVGSVSACSSIIVAFLITKKGLSPMAAFAAALAFGLCIGAAQGYLVSRFKLAPFLVTLGGLFFCRGIGLTISQESIPISNPTVEKLGSDAIVAFKGSIDWPSLFFVALAVVMTLVLRQTRFGRTLFAIGGSAPSAHLMGLPVNRTVTLAYAISGLCAALGGILYAIYTSSSGDLAGATRELDAIAAVVVGGTLLSGGAGSILGTVLGVLTIAIVQTSIDFHGDLSSWWGKIAIGTLLLAFVLLQRWFSGKS